MESFELLTGKSGLADGTNPTLVLLEIQASRVNALAVLVGAAPGSPLSGLQFNLGRLDSGAKFVVGLLSGYSGLAEAPKRAPPPE